MRRFHHDDYLYFYTLTYVTRLVFLYDHLRSIQAGKDNEDAEPTDEATIRVAKHVLDRNIKIVDIVHAYVESGGITELACSCVQSLYLFVTASAKMIYFIFDV